MIQNSFILLPGVRERTESKWWSSGTDSWDDFLGKTTIKGISSNRKDRCDSILAGARQELRQGNAKFFKTAMLFKDQWRLYDTFHDEAVYLDIETDGYYGGITVIGLSDGVDAKTFVRGFNLEKEPIKKELEKYKLLVTFKGASFDMPVIERYFGLKCDLPHVDLRFVCQKAGYTGGLKAIERQVGITRRKEVNGISGEDAVYLWQMWKSTGDRDYLDKLVMYNEEDILNLRPLAKMMVPQVWNKLRNSSQVAGARARSDSQSELPLQQ